MSDSRRACGRSRSRLPAGRQVALALVLLVSSGPMLRSFQNLRSVNPGFDPTSALRFRVGLPRSDYPDRLFPFTPQMMSVLPGGARDEIVSEG